MNEPLSRSEVIVLIDERIKEHDEAVNEPKHHDNKKILGELKSEIKSFSESMIRMEATNSIIMKFAGGGIVVWSIKQLAELVKSFH